MSLTLVIFALGGITVLLSIYVAVDFGKAAKGGGLPLALSWQLYGEALLGFGTLLFAAAAHFGWLSSWSVGFQSTIRFLMFFVTSATTLHLLRTIRGLQQDKG